MPLVHSLIILIPKFCMGFKDMELVNGLIQRYAHARHHLCTLISPNNPRLMPQLPLFLMYVSVSSLAVDQWNFSAHLFRKFIANKLLNAMGRRFLAHASLFFHEDNRNRFPIQTIVNRWMFLYAVQALGLNKRGVLS